MDPLTFVSKLAESFAWPISLLIGLLLLRKPLVDLIPLVQKLKYKEFEIEFGKRVEEVTAEIERELPSQAGLADLASPETSQIYKLAEVSPRSAVLEAWRHVELAALSTATKLIGPQFQNKTMTYQAIRALEKDLRIDPNILGLIRDLRGLRNEAAHAPDLALSKESALEYAVAAQSVIRYLYTAS